MPDREEDKDRLKRKVSQEAIALAMGSRWHEAVAVNESIVESFPTDIDAYNRLGRALMELGEFDRAREAYRRALELNRNNVIAQRNLRRLSLLSESQEPPKGERRGVPPNLFIGEMGKAGVVNLHNLAAQEVLARMAAGDRVYLKVRGQHIAAENEEGEYLGQVDPQHGFRLAKLMGGGNGYAAAIVSLSHDRAKILIREAYQHPSQVGRVSFPARGVEGFQPHVKDTLLRYEAMEEEAPEGVESGELEEGDLLPEGFSIFEGVSSSEEESIQEDLMRED